MVSFLDVGRMAASELSNQAVSDKALGSLMLLVAAFVFVYYTTWAILLVSTASPASIPQFTSHVHSRSSTRRVPYTTTFLLVNGLSGCLHSCLLSDSQELAGSSGLRS